ncbi:MAG: hypothetical protein IPJ14_14910 [Kineosporiaceae bacterium]|nr:hypothetical protein [Kineosporiaceae bacterium]MBK7623908.1 hypothetical protein [Kineosporiaceae bacterium]
MTDLGTATAPRHVAVSLPQAWFELDLSRPGTAKLTRELDRRIREHPELLPHRRAILATLRSATEEALAEGLIFAAALAEPMDDGSLLLATAAGVLSDAPVEVLVDSAATDTTDTTDATDTTDTTDALNTAWGESVVDVAALAAQVTAREPAAGHDDAAVVTGGEVADRPAGWRRVVITQVDAGACVQVHGLDTVEVEGETREFFTLQTLVPVPRRAALLTFVLTTPNIALADEFEFLFRSISSTIDWAEATPTPGPAQPGTSESHPIEREN